MRCTQRLTSALLLTGFLSFAPGLAWGQEDSIPTGIRAGQEAYQQAEAERRAAVGTQIELNSIMRSRVPWSSPYGETIYYAPPGYSYGSQLSRGGYGSGVTMHAPYAYQPRSYLGTTAAFGLGTYHAYPSLFAYAYPPPMIRQPIGQRQVQTGPTRWESYPIYGDEDRPGPVVLTPPAAVTEPPRASEPPPVPHEPKTRRGPREF